MSLYRVIYCNGFYINQYNITIMGERIKCLQEQINWCKAVLQHRGTNPYGGIPRRAIENRVNFLEKEVDTLQSNKNGE